MNDTPAKPAGDVPPSVASNGRGVHSPRVLASQELFAGGHELHIEHNGFVYTLRLTSKGKLILTK